MPKSSLAQRYHMPEVEAERHAHAALEKCAELACTPNPIHYTLLFEYLAGVDPCIQEEMAQALQLRTYSDEVAEEIYLQLITKLITGVLPTSEIETLFEELRHTTDAWLDHFSAEQQALKEDIQALKNAHDSQACPEVMEKLDQTILPHLTHLESAAQQLMSQISTLQRQFDKLRYQFSSDRINARIDPLSGLLNRRGLMEKLEEIMRDAADSGETFSIILIDIDHFKCINDTFGHVVGDSVIRYLSRILKNETKGQDVVARIGGEEFVIILPHTTYDGAHHVADHIRQNVARKKLAVKLNNQPLQFTISAGIAVYQLGESIDTLFERADKALYHAKRHGRNRVCGEHEH